MLITNPQAWARSVLRQHVGQFPSGMDSMHVLAVDDGSIERQRPKSGRGLRIFECSGLLAILELKRIIG
jgi:hypothetical protein